MRVLPASSYVFADLDRLDMEATERIALLRRVLQDAGPRVRLFNDPIRFMRRFEPLRHLYAWGLNDFNVYRLADIREVQRFPVFLRAEDGHAGSLTPLLRYSEQLERATGWVTPAEVLPFSKNSCSFSCRSHADMADSYLWFWLRILFLAFLPLSVEPLQLAYCSQYVERRGRRRPARQPAGSPRLLPSCLTLRRMLTEPQTPVRPGRRAAA